MKDLKKLEGAKMLSKMDQKSIKGGVFCQDCPPQSDCCIQGVCGMIQEWNNGQCYPM